MFQVPAYIWQQIAKAKRMHSRWGKAMEGGQSAIDSLLRQVEAEQEALGVENRVTLAFEQTAPLIVEGDAIREWLRETDSYALSQVLVDLPTPREAVELMTLEYELTDNQQVSLESLLLKELAAQEPVSAESQNEDEFAYQLLVDRGHVIQGLRALRIPRKVKAHERAILGFDGHFLTVEAFDQSFMASAQGTWPGNAHVSASLISVLVQVPPLGDPLVVRCDGAHVSLGTLRIGCVWRPVSASLMKIPAARDWLAALALAYTLPRGQIVTEGLAKEVAQAEQKLALIIARIAKTLAPMGVTTEDVTTLVERRLKERYTPRSPP